MFFRKLLGLAMISGVAALGCGDNSVTNDASVIVDAATDSSAAVDLAPLPVTVTLKYHGAVPPQSLEIPVIFSHPNGDVTTVVNADSQGKAQAVVEEGSSVTVVVHDPSSGVVVSLVTAVGVKPGDSLTGDIGLTMQEPTVVTVRVRVPFCSLTACKGGNGVNYRFNVGCDNTGQVNPDGSGQLSGEMKLGASCIKNNQFNVVATAYDNSNQQPVAIGSSLNLPVPSSSGTIDLMDPLMFSWTTAMGKYTTSATAPPAWATDKFKKIEDDVQEHHGNMTFKATANGNDATPLSRSVTYGFPTTFVPDVLDLMWQAVWNTVVDAGDDDKAQYMSFYFKRKLPFAGIFTDDLGLNLGQLLLPRFTALPVTHINAGEITLSFDKPADMPDTVDGAAFMLFWAIPTDAAQPAMGMWMITVPPGVTSPFKLPTLPSALNVTLPLSAGMTMLSMIYIDSDAIAGSGYDEFRAKYALDGLQLFTTQGFGYLPVNEAGTSRMTMGGVFPSN